MSLFKNLFAGRSMASLSGMSDDRLRDLGLSRRDLIDARVSGKGFALLQSRAAERALEWMR